MPRFPFRSRAALIALLAPALLPATLLPAWPASATPVTTTPAAAAPLSASAAPPAGTAPSPTSPTSPASPASPAVRPLAPCPTRCLDGTVAAGGPVSGTVLLRDAAGQRREARLDDAGRFRLAVADLRPPFVLRASVVADERGLDLHAAALREDIGRHIAITPLSDLVLGNVAGLAPARFFDAPDAARLSRSELDAARDTLDFRLRPLLAAFGVARDFDWLRARFATDGRGFDGALAVLRVSIDDATRRARIRDLVTGIVLDDDLARRDDRDALPAPTAAQLAGAGVDLAAARASFARLNALFGHGLPPAGDPALLALFDPGFLHDGRDLVQTLSPQGWLAPENAGFHLGMPRILGRGRDGRLLRVGYDWRNGAGESGRDSTELRQTADGRWRLAGNRRVAEVRLVSQLQQPVEFRPGIQRYERKLDIEIDSPPRALQYVIVAGPGLPGPTDWATVGRHAGLLLVRGAGPRGGFAPVDAGLAPLEWGWVPDCADLPPEGAGLGTDATGAPGNAGSGAAAVATTAPARRPPCVDFTRLGAEADLTVTFLDAARAPLNDPAPVEYAADWSAHMQPKRRDSSLRPSPRPASAVARPGASARALATTPPGTTARAGGTQPGQSMGAVPGGGPLPDAASAPAAPAPPGQAGAGPANARRPGNAAGPAQLAPPAQPAATPARSGLAGTLADLRDWARALRRLASPP
ncbi:hypothetical protein [Derxia gummosa]|uniref:Carboxypeptidase regulatory-like domain-containing protein n=1 Tax=Derxia gummosa DSM 723 TaxID=1121388 RepID=A0A8B6X5D7_9BURK|nr:hypothetical protein [Derxia gummosa]